MHRALTMILLGLLLVVETGPVWGLTAQQEKMKDCNAQATAKALNGDARKDFMKTCLSTNAATSAANSQQAKMRTCNSEANGQSLKGDARKTFMKNCLSGSSATK